MSRLDNWKFEAEERIKKLDKLGIPIKSEFCGAKRREGNTCHAHPGLGTTHHGIGPCWAHGGNTKRENAIGAWMMAHEIARSLNVTPWEALLGEVRRSAGEVAWLDWKVAQAPSDGDLLDGEYARWDAKRGEARRWLGRVSKMALDAGVAERLVAQYQFEAEAIASVLLGTLEDLGWTPDQIDQARPLFRRRMLALSAESEGFAGDVIEGEEV